MYGYKDNDASYKELLEYRKLVQKVENDIKILYNKKLEGKVDYIEFKEKYGNLKNKEKDFISHLESLEERYNYKISENQLLDIIKKFKNASEFDNSIMKKLINKIEVYEDRTVNITFNF